MTKPNKTKKIKLNQTKPNKKRGAIMLKTNRNKTVAQSVTGRVHNPTVRKTVQRICADGGVAAYPSVGAICYNVTIGDSVFGWAGDHVEPDVSCSNADPQENDALNFLSCVGNVVTVVSGEAKGRKGYVTGKHGGVEHLIVWFDEQTKNMLCPDDKILVRAQGQGLKIEGLDCVRVLNTSPDLLEKLPIEYKDGKLHVKVAGIVPAHFMGCGIGSQDAATGDYDIMTADKKSVAQAGLDGLKFGDLVFLQDCDNTLGRGYFKGSGTVGVVVHSDCVVVGHGPGVTTLLTSKENVFEPQIDKNANIGRFLGIIK